MTKTLSTILLWTAMSVSPAFAQKDKEIPAFGKVEKADLEMKVCDFDKNAEALILFDVGEIYCSLHYTSVNFVSTVFEKRVRIKILSDKGLSHADISINYLGMKEGDRVKNISAQTYNLDPAGNIVTTKVEKALMYDKKINNRYSKITFTFPAVKAGSIIEYKYTVERNGLDGVKTWYFQKDVPVRFSRYTVNFPNELEVDCMSLGAFQVAKKAEAKGGRDIQAYSLENIPALRDEAYISCEEDYLQRMQPRLIAFQPPGGIRQSLVRTWPGVVKTLMEDEDFGVQLKKNIPRTADLDLMLKPVTDPYRRMVIIHDYVRKNMQWNGYDNIWALDGVKSAWKDKKGTSGEINLILVNLLKEADLNAKPMLVSTRSNGLVNIGLPSEGQFDKVMAYVIIGSKVYVLDATEKYTPAKLMPYDVMYSQGLVIEKFENFEWGWRDIWDEKQAFRNVIIVNADIDEKGEMKGTANVTSIDYARLERMPKFKEGKDKFIEAHLNETSNQVLVDSIEFENGDVDSLPLVQRFQFTQPLNSAGEYRYFSANLFTGLGKNKFLSDQRFSDVFFGANQRFDIVGTYNIPEGYTFEELPKNLRMIMPDTSISLTRTRALQGNQLSVRMTLEFKKPFFTAEEYGDFQEFYKQLFDIINQQYVIKKIKP